MHQPFFVVLRQNSLIATICFSTTDATTGSSGLTVSGAGLFGGCATDQQHGRQKNYDTRLLADLAAG
jgi:hypothetical protein